MMQCSTFCSNSDICSAYIWDDKSLECSIFDNDSVICDDDQMDSIKMIVDETNPPSSCIGS